MIYFLYGQDSYRAKQKLEEIISHYKKIHKSGVNLVYIDAEKDGFETLSNGFKIVSMFAEKKLFILKNIFSRPEFQEKFLKEIKALNNSKDIIVVYEKEPIDAKNKLLKALKKEVKCQEFKPLDASSLRKWTSREFEKYGAKIDASAENLLLASVGNDLWQLQNEINKLANFKNRKIIKKEDGKIDWLKSAEQIEKQIRAFNPWPGTFTFWKKNKKVIRVKILEAEVSKSNQLIIKKVQPEGKKPMGFEEFKRGYLCSIIPNLEKEPE